MIPATGLDPIQMLWVRGDLSRLELLSVRSFLAHGHPVILYTYDPARNLPPGVVVRDAAEIVPLEKVPTAHARPFGKGTLGAFSDYFRYHLLTARGGWWVDMDIVCTRPWRFAQPALTASTHEEGFGRIANTCVMRFPAQHPLMEACRATLAPIDVNQVDISQTGPLLLHRLMGEMNFSSLAVAPEVFCPVPWNASWQLLRPLWQRFTLDELKQRLRRPHLSMQFTPASVATHLWNETWRDAGWDKHARFASTCLYERYQRRWNPSSASTP
jgi:hypothetical protein